MAFCYADFRTYPQRHIYDQLQSQLHEHNRALEYTISLLSLISNSTGLRNHGLSAQQKALDVVRHYMKTFSFDLATDKSIGRTWPQTDGWNVDYPFVFELDKYFLTEPPDEIGEAFFRIKSSAKLTDFISSGMLMGSGFVMSKNAYDLFCQFKILKHKVYPFTIVHKNKRHDNYIWFHICDNHSKDIDFERTKFTLKSMPLWDIPNWDYNPEPLQIDNHESFLRERKRYAGVKNIVVDGKIFLSKDSKKNDWYYFYGIHQPNRISESLARSIKDNLITGLDVVKSENVLLDE